MGSKSSPPAAPNAGSVAGTQSDYNRSTALFNAGINRYNVNTPFGSQTWAQNGTDPATGAPMYTQNVSLTPNAQTALSNQQQTQAGLSGLQNQALGGVNNAMNENLFSASNLPAASVHAGQTGQDALMERLQPEMDLQSKQFEQNMANRGIPLGSDAYDQAKRSLTNQQNDMSMQAALNGINVGNQAQNQAMQTQSYLANSPLNYLNALMSGSQVQTPTFQGTPSVSANAPDYQSAINSAYAGQLNGYNAATGQQNSLTSGLFGLGQAGLTGYFSS